MIRARDYDDWSMAKSENFLAVQSTKLFIAESLGLQVTSVPEILRKERKNAFQIRHWRRKFPGPLNLGDS